MRWCLLASGFFWNVGLGLTTLLIPLQARAMGFSASAIGGLLGIPVVLQLIFLLIGGAYTDRVGGRKVMVLSCALLAACGCMYAFASGIVTLMLAQALLVISRSVFWPALWSLNADARLDDGKGVGYLNAIVNAGQLSGTLLAGVLLSAAGYATGFGALVALGVAAAILVLQLPPKQGAPVPGRGAANLSATYLRLLREPGVQHANLCSFVSAVPLTLSASFIPLLLVTRGFDPDSAGVALSLRAVGAIAAGFIVGWTVRRVPSNGAPVGFSLMVAVCLAMLAVAGSGGLAVGIVMFLLGLGASGMNAYFQMLLPHVAKGQQRGSVMAIGSLGVMFSHIAIPPAMGLLTDAYGITVAFAGAAALSACCAVAMPLMQKRAFP
jgi:NNP family nitrate/nitrite transporter-like MFS transporter